MKENKRSSLRIRWLFWLCALICLCACQPINPQRAPALPESERAALPHTPADHVEPTLDPDAPLPIFDTHMHYSQEAWSVFSPAEIIDKLENAHVERAVVSSTPDDGTRMLYAADPARIVPFLRPYRGNVTSSNWYLVESTLPYLTERLATPLHEDGAYRGIGEFHLHYEGDANTPIVREVARMAVERGYYLNVHSDAAAVRAIFANEPEIKILWAHAGMTEPPNVVSQMLDDFANLWTDISYRENAIAPDGVLDPAWRDLFLRHPDRITIGSDTWINPRWRGYQQIIEFDRGWLNQLPREVAEQIAWANAARLFGATDFR